MIYFSIIFLVLIMFYVTNIIGNYVLKKFNLNDLIPSEILGFLTWLSILFIISQFLDLDSISSYWLFQIFLIVTTILVLVCFRSFHFSYNLKEVGIIVTYTLLLVILSTRYTLGEQLGDNVFLFTLVSKNINTPLLNNFDLVSGYVFEGVAGSAAKDALTFFHFNSFVLHYFYKIKEMFSSEYIPAYLLYMWVNNILFYFFSSSIIISIIRIMKVKIWTSILIVLFSGLFIGSYYYNITLPHFGVTYLGLGVSLSLLLIWEYLEKRQIGYVISLVFVFFAMNSMASAGMLMTSFISFGFISILIIQNDESSLLFASLLLIPIAVFANQVKVLITVPLFIPIITGLILVFIILNYIKYAKMFIYKYFKIILLFFWVSYIITSIIFVPDYFEKILHFSDIKENYDRVRDFFSFTNFYQTLLNLLHYILLINLLLNKKTRYFGLIFLIIILFFINPLSYPLLYKYTEWLYHRSYFTLFNITSISFGIFATINNLEGLKVILKKTIKIILTIAIIFFTFTNITTYENIIYIPGEDFSPLYKMNRQQIDILLKLYYEVQMNNKKNTRVISQIYGTLMIVPDIYHYMFTVSDRRYWIPDEPELFPELYKMMYTPVFPGDDGPRYDMDYSRLCYVLGQEVEKIDYLLLDNTLTTFDSATGNWVPMHWFARACSEKIYENERYTLYKYWGLGNQ